MYNVSAPGMKFNGNTMQQLCVSFFFLAFIFQRERAHSLNTFGSHSIKRLNDPRAAFFKSSLLHSASFVCGYILNPTA